MTLMRLMRGRNTIVQDCLFLGLVVLLSVILYIQDLGFYSDDWSFLAGLSLSGDQSFTGLFRSLNAPWVRMRPVQLLYWAAQYWLFGPYPLGYHIVNTVVQFLSVTLLYLALRRLNQRRILALAISLVYGLLPHYSTDRFWIAAAQINLSMALFLLSLYSDLKAIQVKKLTFWAWKLLSILGLLGSTLAYEMTLPLFLFTPLLVWYRSRSDKVPLDERVNRTKLVSIIGINLLALILVSVFKAYTTVRITYLGPKEHTIWFVKLILGAIRVSYGEYGLGLPVAVWQIFQDYPDRTILAFTILMALTIFGYLIFNSGQARSELSDRWQLINLITAGIVVFGLGYAIFLTNTNANNSMTGIGNRIAIVASLGVSLTLVGVIGWISTLLPIEKLVRLVFSALIALLCASGFLINNTIATFWAAAYEQEKEILSDIRQQFPVLPPNSTFILDGVCPYIGPAIVFESDWDLAGALQILYDAPRLRANVVTSNMEATEEGLVTSLYYGAIMTHHPYSEQLRIYHHDRKITRQLTNQTSANDYFQSFNPDYSSGCPEGREGYGVPIFNVDKLAQEIQRLEDQPFVTQEIRYHQAGAGEVFLVWGFDNWEFWPRTMHPPGTVVKNSAMHTPMKDMGGIFVTQLHFPTDTTPNGWFLITKTNNDMPVEFWDGNGNHAYQIPITNEGIFEVNHSIDTTHDNLLTDLEDERVVTQEVRYSMPEAGEVYFLWGTNAWGIVPAEMRPDGTIVKDSVMHSVMSREGDNFVIRVQVPAGAALNYGFQIRKTRDGAPVTWIWDGDYQMNPLADGITEVKPAVALEEEQLLEGISPPEPAVLLSLGLAFIASIVTVLRKRSALLSIPTTFGSRLTYLRDLLRELVIRDIKLRYKRSFLGIIWSLFNPLAQLLVFSLIFGMVLPLGIPNYASFVFVGLLSWNWFYSSLFQATEAIVSNPELIRRPGFPTAVLPIVTVATHFIHFLLALPILLAFLLYTGTQFSVMLLLLPFLIVLQFFFILGLAYFVAAIHVIFRDIQHLLGIFLFLFFYLTPIFYDARAIPDQYQTLYNLNPMVHIINAYRAILMHAEWPATLPLVALVILSVVLLYIGYTIFMRTSYRFVEEL